MKLNASVVGLVAATLTLLFGLSVGAASTYGSVKINNLVFQVAQHECRPNEGLEVVQLLGLPWERRYTFVCKNGAHFLDRVIDAAPPEGVLKTSEVLK